MSNGKKTEKTVDVPRFLASAFTRRELRILNHHPHFKQALRESRLARLNDFERLAITGQQLLDEVEERSWQENNPEWKFISSRDTVNLRAL